MGAAVAELAGTVGLVRLRRLASAVTVVRGATSQRERGKLEDG